LAVLLIIQFFRFIKNVNATPLATINDISTAYPVPYDVRKILKTICYDCRSNNTTYPWYSTLYPVAWWLNYHIEQGKGKINLNEFASYRPALQYKKF